VLATRHGGIPEAVIHERTGLLVAEKDDAALFHAMCEITAHTDSLYIYGAAASRIVREEFEQAKAIEALETIYDEARVAVPAERAASRG
jgi:glycosyltransferase involved in cell wall biosynthesis